MIIDTGTTRDTSSKKAASEDYIMSTELTSLPDKVINVTTVRTVLPPGIPPLPSNTKILNCWELFDKAIQLNTAHRILLYGAPGTGKTTSACLLGKHYSITLHEESCAAELLGHWIKKGESYEYHYGSGILAFKNGDLLVLNEIDKVSSSVMTVLHCLLDDKRIAHITLPNNETIQSHSNFKVIATMNGLPEDISTPLLDRFDVIININQPHPKAVESLSTDLHTILKNSYSTDNPTVTFRKLATFDRMRKVYTPEIAGQLAFGKNYQELLSVIKLGEREVKK